MKKLIVFLLCLGFTSAAFAEYYVVYDKNKEVRTVSEKPNANLPEDLTQKKLPGNLADQEFPVHPNLCKFKNGAFIVNNAKMNKMEQKRQAAEQRAKELEMIENQMKLNALKDLKAKGVSFEQVSEKEFE